MKTKQKFVDQLSWNVFRYDFNNKTINTIDVFRLSSFKDAVVKAYTKYETFKQFSEQLSKEIGYYFWAKCECELLMAGWPPTENREEEIKVDWAGQLKLNFLPLALYIWKTLGGTFYDTNA